MDLIIIRYKQEMQITLQNKTGAGAHPGRFLLQP